MPFMKEVLVQLEGKMPEETIEKLARTLLREMQYQQLRDTAYGTSHSALSEVRESLRPLEDVPKTQRYLVDNINSLLVFQEETKKNYAHFIESNNVFFQIIKDEMKKEEEKIQEQISFLKSLEEKWQKMSQDSQSFSQKQFDGIQTQFVQLQKDMAQHRNDWQKMAEDWQKKIQESILSQMLSIRQEIQKNLQELQSQFAQIQKDRGEQPEFFKKIESLFHQDLQNLEQKALKEIESLARNLEKGEQKIPETLEKDLQNIAKGMELKQQKLESVHEQNQELLQNQKKNEILHAQNHETLQKRFVEISQRIEELSSQIYRTQEALTKNAENPVQESLEELKAMLVSVRGLAQSLQILQHLPEKLNIPENFSAVVESIPASNRKIKEYIELFRQDLSLVSQHSLELLKANKEQTSEFARLQTTLLPEITSLQQNWQKFSLKLDDHWNGSQEILAKNMGELVSAIAQIKGSLNQLGQIPDRPRATFEPTITQEIKDYVRDRMEIAVQNIKESIESAVVNIKKEMKSTLIQEVRQMGEEIKASLQTIKPSDSEKSSKNLKPLESLLDEMSKTMNRIDLRMVSKEPSKETHPSSKDKISCTCPNCGKEVSGSVSYQGKSVTCPSCKDKFTFPTIVRP